MIKKIALLNLIVSGILSVIFLFLMDQNVAISCFFTTALLVLNLTGLYIFWRIVFLKKSIALGLLIIIFKYPLIAYCLWQMSKQTWVHPVGVSSSLLLFLLSIVGVSFYAQKEKPCTLTGPN